MSTLQENRTLDYEEERNKRIRILEERLEEYQKYIDINHKEIERLKEMKLHTEKYASEMEDKYILEKNKNNKAIEFIENTRHTTSMTLEEMCDLEDILKGVDKE